MGQDAPCPKCNIPLEPVTDREVEFQGCGTCFGLWVAEGDLGVYVERASTAESATQYALLLEKALRRPAGGSHARRHCPTCRHPLERLGFGENPFVIIDRCPQHGIWLDRSELKKVVRSCRAAAHPSEPALDDDDDEGEPRPGGH